MATRKAKPARKTPAQKNAANRALATAGKAKPRTRKPAISAMATHLDPAKLADRLRIYLYDEGAKRLNAERMRSLGLANDCWPAHWDDVLAASPGRARMILGLSLRRKLEADLPLVFPE
jgi:hypothetical protein